MEQPSAEDIEQTIPLRVQEIKKEVGNLKFLQKLKDVKDNITVEPVMSVFMIASMIAVTGVQNLNLDKACRVNLNYNDTVCTALTLRQRENYSNAEVDVQKLVASVEAWRTIIATVFPLIMMVFLGAWSDKMGKRKVCMLMPIAGEFISCSMNIMSFYFFDSVTVELTSVLSTLAIALGGAWYVMYLGSYSYLADVTSEQSRTFRMGLLTLGLSISFPIGMGISGIILRYTGYYGVFGIPATMQLLNFLYICFFIKDKSTLREKKSKNNRPRWVQFLIQFFNLQSLKDMLGLLLKRRPNNQRMKLILIMIAVCLINGPFWGELSIFYIACRYRFNFDEIKYSIFTSYNLTLHAVGTLFTISLFTKKLKMDDSTLGMIATLSRILGAFVWVFARNELEVYLAPVAEFFDGTMIIALRAMASKFVTSSELGKVFSLFGVLEVTMMLVLAPIYSRVYIATIHILPGAAYFITIMCSIPAVCIFIWFHREYKRELKTAARAAVKEDCAEEIIK
ncbi:proton-coupled folate transporter-like [Aricia agestis]|uniref:proton-coupled folate transporter-like n=1 Tax=Aricia agestis TaxID=91739 RepID=UPI001C2040A9|nr:proton-coupled folate transporter-like [Aricia agestis]